MTAQMRFDVTLYTLPVMLHTTTADMPTEAKLNSHLRTNGSCI